MARGVAKRFVRILRDEQRTARSRAVVVGVLAIILVVPSFLMAPPIGVLIHLGAAVVGLAIGAIWGGVVYGGRYQRGLSAAWKPWMEAANGSETLAECHRKVIGRSGRNLPILYGLALTIFWVLELGLLILALMGQTSVLTSAPVIAGNGLLVGAIIGHALRALSWSRDFLSATEEMIQSGEVGVWGTH